MELNIYNMSNLTKKLLFYSPQGGTGKSIIATNISIIASFLGIKTLLLDVSIFGSISTLLRLYTKSQNNISNIVDAIRNNNEIDTKFYLKILNDNLFVIQNCNATKMIKITVKEIYKILNFSTNLNFDLIIIDTSSELNKKNFFLFENADHIIIPSIQDISCTWKILQFKELINKNFMKDVQLSTILNRCSKTSGFNNSKYELDTGIRNIFQLPDYQKNFQSYINQGYMLNSNYNKGAYSDFLKLTQIILNMSDININK